MKNFMSHGGIDKLNEECGEVIQVIGKFHGMGAVLGDHWDGSHLGQRLEEEIGDVLAAAKFVIEKHKLDSNAINLRQRDKLAKFRAWDRGEDA